MAAAVLSHKGGTSRLTCDICRTGKHVDNAGNTFEAGNEVESSKGQSDVGGVALVAGSFLSGTDKISNLVQTIAFGVQTSHQ